MTDLDLAADIIDVCDIITRVEDLMPETDDDGTPGDLVEEDPA